MTYIIHRGIVEEHLILSRGAASYLKTAGGIAFRLHARQQLDTAHDVVLAEQLGSRCQVVYLQHLGSCLYVLDTLTGGV